MNLRALCDLIANDLEANLVLPAHHRWRYLPPRTPTPEFTPLLSVYPNDSSFAPLATTDEYSAAHDVTIEWTVELPGVESGGIEDPSVAAVHLEHAEAILQHLTSYADGLPGAEALLGTLRRASYQPDRSGLMWTFQAVLTVDDVAY